MSSAEQEGAASVARCREFYDGIEESPRTHTCSLVPGHAVFHRCPTCGCYWDHEQGVIPAGEADEPRG